MDSSQCVNVDHCHSRSLLQPRRRRRAWLASVFTAASTFTPMISLGVSFIKKLLPIARAGTDLLPQYLVLGFRYFAFNKANVQLMLGLRAHPERFGSSRSCARPPFVSQISNNQFSNAGSSHWRCFRGTLVLRRGATPGKRLAHPSLGTTACKRFQAPCSNTSTTRTGRSVREQDPPRASGPAPRTSLRVGGAGTCSRRGGTTGAEWILLCGANGILLCGATYPPGGGVAARCI